MKKTRVVAVILAAGKGTRMNHELPKALVPVGGMSMAMRLIISVEGAHFGTKPILVVSYKQHLVRAAIGTRARYVVQRQTLGTGHAVMATAKLLKGKTDQVIVIYGDNPFFSTATLKQLSARQRETRAAIVLSTVRVPNFLGPRKLFLKYGHIIRDRSGKNLLRCVEYKDATRGERAVREVNSGAYCFDAKWLWASLPKLKKKNISGEYYLTDLMGLAVSEGHRVVPVPLKNWHEGLGANTLEDVATAERLIK